MSAKRLCGPFCCGPLGYFRAGSSCRTSCKRSPRLPTLSLWSLKAACSISESSYCSTRLTISKWRCLKSSFNCFNLCCSLLAANWSTGDSLSLVSSSPTFSPNLMMEAWIMPRCRRLQVISRLYKFYHYLHKEALSNHNLLNF